jgi:bifunctional non-homologous end joining protein LigD
MKTEQLPSTELGFREGSSDKVYRACVERSGDGFVVNFAYGRRGATLNTGTKTQQPVPYAEALSVYEKLVASKTGKGYKPVAGAQPSTGVGTTVTDREQRDTGLRPQLLNPIDNSDVTAYLTDDRWCAQEKFDGKRMLLRKSGNALIGVNRDGLSVGFPQVYATALAAVPGDFVIDGESVGETFYAFDLLESEDVCLRHMPYRIRLVSLQALFGRIGGSIVVAETVCGNDKRRFLEQLRAAKKEGIVLKDLGAPWTAGRPASGGTALKCKFWATCSCVVLKVNARRSVELELGGRSVGNVSIPPNHEIPVAGQIVEIRYLYVTGLGGSLYQPIYLGVRDDVRIEDCTFERQRIKYKAAA